MKRILITGGTGSFGGTMVRHLLGEKDGETEEVVVFSRDEFKQHQMRQEFGSRKLRFIVGDVRDEYALERAMRGIDAVFHAAALKQVPTGEFSPMEMVRTNVLGTQNVLDAAEQSPSVKKVVLLSTDKAVHPVNAMGISKALAERLVFGKGHHFTDTVFSAVRYGNVMASRGSVIPLFIDQIKKGKDITVTDPAMTRFMLSLDDAIDLVLFAVEHGEQGDLFIRKAPATTVGDLTMALLNIFNAKNKIVVVGTRAGEKVHETLATNLELSRADDFKDYYRIKSQSGLNYEEFYEKGLLKNVEDDYTSENTKRLSSTELEALLRSLDYVKRELER